MAQPQHDETVFVLHGLDIDARNVRADVFALKLRTLIRGLRDADRFANGKVGFDYIIRAIEVGSVSVTIRQRERLYTRSHHSSLKVYEEVANAIYNGDSSISAYPDKLVKNVQQLSKGALKDFSHAELVFSDSNVIRIDEFLERQSEVAYRDLISGPETKADRYYRGRAIGSFDGELKEIDNRGLILRGKLVLSAGNLEIDCVMNKERVPEVREAFDKRVIIEGIAHYDGENQLPIRIDVTTINITGHHEDLLRWRGAFAPPALPEEEEEWC